MRPRLSTAVARTAVMAAARATVERVRLQTRSIAMPRSKETVGLSRRDDDPSPFPARFALVGSYFIRLFPLPTEHGLDARSIARGDKQLAAL